MWLQCVMCKWFNIYQNAIELKPTRQHDYTMFDIHNLQQMTTCFIDTIIIINLANEILIFKLALKFSEKLIQKKRRFFIEGQNIDVLGRKRD